MTDNNLLSLNMHLYIINSNTDTDVLIIFIFVSSIYDNVTITIDYTQTHLFNVPDDIINEAYNLMIYPLN